MKTLILNREYKNLPSAKTFCKTFAAFNFVIVLLAAVNHKIESDIEFSGHRDQVTIACLLAKQWSICVKMMARYWFLFLLVFFSVMKFDKKCTNSTQRSQSPNF